MSDINTISKEIFETVLSKRTVERLMQERNTRPFSSMEEVGSRVYGIGPAKINKLIANNFVCIIATSTTSDKEKVLARFKKQIYCDLTTGRLDQDLTPYTTSQIEAYILKHEHTLEIAVKEYLEDLDPLDGDIDTHMNDWFNEILYLHVDSYSAPSP